MKVLKNILYFVYAMLIIFFYKFLASKFGLPTFVAGQWYVLSAIVVYIVGIIAIGGIVVNLVHHYEGDGETSRDFKTDLFNYLGGKKVSIVWQVIAFIIAGVFFQYSEYIAAVAVAMIGTCVATFRMMQNATVEKAEIVVIKDSLSNKRK